MTRMGELEANGVTDGIQSGFDRGVLRFITAGSVASVSATSIVPIIAAKKMARYGATWRSKRRYNSRLETVRGGRAEPGVAFGAEVTAAP